MSLAFTDNTGPSNALRIALLAPAPVNNGAVNMLLTLSGQLAQRGCTVDLLAASTKGANREWSGAHMQELGARRPVRAVPQLARYLRAARPDALIATEYYSGLPALYGIALARTQTRCIIRQDNHWSMAQGLLRGHHRWLTPTVAGRLFRRAEIVAVSNGVAEDLIAHVPALLNNTSVIYNPVITECLHERASEIPGHPWFHDGRYQVILGTGRLVEEKGFANLIRAFATAALPTSVRLAILGEGPERPKLEQLIAGFNIAERCQLIGFQANPYMYMARSALFVLPSRFEGLPTVLIEALSLKAPVIATDCPSGPAEILQHGRYGVLIPPDDIAALRHAIEHHFAQPVAVPKAPIDWLRNFAADVSAARHQALIEASLAGPPPQRRNHPLHFQDPFPSLATSVAHADATAQ